MKKLLISALLGAATVVAFGQGQVSINTSGPAGTYTRFALSTGGYAAGNAFNAALYWATDQATLLAGGGTMVQNGGLAGDGIANFTGGAGGYISATTGGGNRTVTGRGGQDTWFQLRAWSTGYATYGDAVASGLATVLITKADVAPTVMAKPSATAVDQPTVLLWSPGTTTAAGAVIVTLVPVPEPATFALVGLGLLGLVFLRRRK